MARKKSKSKAPRRRKSKAINLLNLGEGLLVGNIITETVFNSNMWDFFTAGSGLPFSQEFAKSDGTMKVTLLELIQWKGDASNVGSAFGTEFGTGRMDVIKQNLQANLLGGVLTLAGVKVGSKILKKQLRPTFKQVNQVIDMSGFGQMVKV